MAAIARFSIVSAVYNVQRYLPEFIASIEAQDFPADQLEVIMVDDGSTDGSARMLADWQRRRPELVTVLTKDNGGQASARNLGIEHARGEWVTMPDPDDTLADNYFTEVATFLAKFPETELVATHRILVSEETGTRSQHPLSSHFQHSNRLRDLDEHPTFFHGSAPAAFFRTEALRRESLRFDEQIRPNFEDGHFCTAYLLRLPAPLVGFVRTAEYFYRKRADGSSTLNTSRLDARRYTTVLRRGYLDLLEQAKARRGTIPAWVQNLVVYELSWYFHGEESATGLSVALDAVAPEFHALLVEIIGHLDAEIIRSFTLRPLKPIWRDILLHGYDPVPWHSEVVRVEQVDMAQKLVRVTYRYTGPPPQERFLVDGVETAPVHGKVRSPEYFRRTLVQERIAWLPYGALSAELAGRPVPFVLEEPEVPRLVLEGWRARDRYDQSRVAKRVLGKPDNPRRTLKAQAWRALAHLAPVRRVFGAAWVLMDRVVDADDSGEHLFRYLRAERPEINAWFVVARGPDHRRLRRHSRRVIAHGGLLWTLLMLNCQQLVSSHADKSVHRPQAILDLTPPTWRFVFLQHGVTKDDLSLWLNPKNASVFVVSTDAEYHALIDDGTGYTYTTREVKLTGLPRFDAIRAAGARVGPDGRDLIVIAPTWRQWLATVSDVRPQGWEVAADAFVESEFARSWTRVLSSEALADAAKRHHLRIALLMHPILQSVVGSLELPDWVERLDFDDVRSTFARARVLVTDYSSMAFNVAYLDRPVVYFQFDRDLVLDGGHVGRRGYFDYERDGFGPVTLTADDAIDTIVRAVDAGPDPDPTYQQRIDEAFPLRDGRCCERVTDAILDSMKLAPRSGPDVEPS